MAKVLLLEDDKFIARALKKLLECFFSAEVIIAENGIDAFESLSDMSPLPDLILSDIHMPLMDGQEFLKLLRKNASYKDLPVIILSSDGNRDIVEDTLKNGIEDYILKPLDKNQIFTKLRKYFTADYESSDINMENDMRAEFYGKKILVASKDGFFINSFTNLFEDRFEIYFVENGAQCLKKFTEIHHDIVILESGLDIIDEESVADKIRDLDDGGRVQIFQLIDEGMHSDLPAVFTDYIEKHFEVADLLKHFSRKVLNISDMFDITMGIVKYFRNDLFNIMQIYFERRIVYIHAMEKQRYKEIKLDTYGVIDFNFPGEDFVLSFLIVGDQKCVTDFVKRCGDDATSKKGVMNKLGEFVSDMAKEAQGLLRAKGLSLTMGELKIKTSGTGIENYPLTLKVPFETRQGQKLMGVVSIRDKK